MLCTQQNLFPALTKKADNLSSTGSISEDGSCNLSIKHTVKGDKFPRGHDSVWFIHDRKIYTFANTNGAVAQFNSKAVFFHVKVDALRSSALVHSTLITQFRNTIPRPGHQRLSATHHHRGLTSCRLNRVSDERLDIGP